MHYQAPDDLLKQRTILVTGAGDGIGREAALTYAHHGANVILLGRTQQKLEAVQKQISRQGGFPAQIYTMDMLTITPETCQALLHWLTERTSQLDGVLHNAGILGQITPIIRQDPDVWREVIDINVNATFMLTQTLLPLLLQSASSTLIFTSSSVGRQGRANWGAYAVSKFATEGLMQVLAEEYRHTSLRVNCINPGGTLTAMRASAFPDEKPEQLKTPTALMPLYLYLMGDDSLGQHGISFDAQSDRKPGPAY